MIHILTDSCSDLGQELIDQHNIEFISLAVFMDNHDYRDQVDLDTQTLFSLVEKTGDLPKTSAPPVTEFSQFLDRDGETIFIGISSKLSATVNNARLSCQNLPSRSIHIIDSLNLSSGIGLLVLKAAELRGQGYSAEYIEQVVSQAIPKVHSSFVIDTLDYLYKGGRCSAISMVVGSLLKIRPVIEVRPDGTLGVKEKITGSRKKALDSLILDIKKHLHELDPHRVFITHTGCPQDAQYLADELRKLTAIENLHITIAGATIASHCGPNTIGILYLTK